MWGWAFVGGGVKLTDPAGGVLHGCIISRPLVSCCNFERLLMLPPAALPPTSALFVCWPVMLAWALLAPTVGFIWRVGVAEGVGVGIGTGTGVCDVE